MPGRCMTSAWLIAYGYVPSSVYLRTRSSSILLQLYNSTKYMLIVVYYLSEQLTYRLRTGCIQTACRLRTDCVQIVGTCVPSLVNQGTKFQIRKFCINKLSSRSRPRYYLTKEVPPWISMGFDQIIQSHPSTHPTEMDQNLFEPRFVIPNMESQF